MPKSKTPYLEDDSKIIAAESLILRWIPVAQIPNLLWEKNPKLHDIGETWASIVKSGYADPAKWDINLKNKAGGQGALVYGNGRSEAVWWGWQQFKQGLWEGDLPRGVGQDNEGNWFIQCKFGLDADSEAAAADFALAHNNITMMGGDFADGDIWRMYDLKTLEEVGLLIQGNTGFDPLAMNSEELSALQTYMAGQRGLVDDGQQEDEDEFDSPDKGTLLKLLEVTIKEPRHRPVTGDVWQLGDHFLFCVDVLTGWGKFIPYLNSENCLLCPYAGPYLALGERAKQFKLIIVQPDLYIAGHILDIFETIIGKPRRVEN